METKLLIDNWMLQDVNQALERGLSEDFSGEILIDTLNNSHDFNSMPHAVFQIDALLSLLTNIVLRDRLIVDGGFTYVWKNGHESLQTLRSMAIINLFDFLSSEELIAGPRKIIVDELCVTQSIRAVQRKNERLWEKRKESADKHMSQLVWGAAGYLARSHVYETPYLGCPFRQALIRQTKFVGVTGDAVRNVEYIINTKRAKLFQKLSLNRSSTYGTFNLPPVAIEVIGDSSEPGQLITVAVQLREKYKKLRTWLGEYQQALDSEDPQKIKKYVMLLESIARDIDSNYPSKSEDSVRLSLGTSWLGISAPVSNLVEKVRNKFGVRAMLSHIISAERGRKSLKKLLNMFGEKNTMLSATVHQHLISRYSKDA
jgi:hypothetical protein